MDLADCSLAELEQELLRRNHDVDLKADLIKDLKATKFNLNIYSKESIVNLVESRTIEISVNQLNNGEAVCPEEALSLVECLQATLFGEDYFERISDFT